MDSNNSLDRQDILLIIIVGVILFLYMSRMYETYSSGSYDITPSITTQMDWKGSQLSGIPYYPNNLNNPPQNVDVNIRKLQSYDPETDGKTNSVYVSSNMQNNLGNNLEGFTMMNPYVPN